MKSFRSGENVAEFLAKLETLSVDQVQVNEWNDIVALTNLPRLYALRFHNAPLLKVRMKKRENRFSFRFVWFSLKIRTKTKETETIFS